MQRTLFFYIFKDLLRVFLLASGALAGIMSFGGLLRPLTQHGLDLNQVAQMLMYFMPAMTNYSWPVAVLFATTFVYGRLASDNELTACRAAGMSYLDVLWPALSIGLTVSLVSYAFLCFVVPHSFLKAEKVVYSNLAQLVANQISRTQQVNLAASEQSITIFARSAQVLQPNPVRPFDQAVELTDVSIVTYQNNKDRTQPKVPNDFYLAKSAMAVISMPKDVDGEVKLFVKLEGGTKVPRGSDTETGRLVSMGIDATAFGPETLASPVRETARFMDIKQLLDLRAKPDHSKRIRGHVKTLTEFDQLRVYMAGLLKSAKAGQTITVTGTDNELPVTFTIPIPKGTSSSLTSNGYLVLSRGSIDEPGLQLTCDSATIPFTANAREIVITAQSTSEKSESVSQPTIYPKIEVRDATLWYKDQPSELQSKQWNLAVPMPANLEALAKRSARDYLTLQGTFPNDKIKGLRYDIAKQQNQIESELHARLSFALSSVVLALVGAIIGMQFKSGNFVSAFAVSVGPALLAIVLIVTGQHIAESVPKDIGPNYQNPLSFGLSVIWSGVTAVAVLGTWLFLKLSRT